MKKFLLFLFSLLIGIGLFFWVIKTIGWQEIERVFLVFTGWQGMAILGLTLLIALIGNWKWQEILKGEGVQISFRSLFSPYLAGFALMFLAPILVWGGEIFRGYALKEKNKIPWSKGMASITIDRVSEGTTNLAVIFFGILFFLLTIGSPPKKLAAIFGGILFLLTVSVFFFYFKIFKRESLAKAVGRIFNHRLDNQPLEIEKEIFEFFKPKKKAMWKSFGLSFLKTGMTWFRTWLLIVFLGKSAGALPSLSILGFSYLAAMIPIPAAIGSHEAVQAFAFNALGLGANTGTAFTLIIRGAESILALFGVIILFKLGIELLKNTLFKKLDSFRFFNYPNRNEG